MMTYNIQILGTKINYFLKQFNTAAPLNKEANLEARKLFLAAPGKRLSVKRLDVMFECGIKLLC